MFNARELFCVMEMDGSGMPKAEYNLRAMMYPTCGTSCCFCGTYEVLEILQHLKQVQNKNNFQHMHLATANAVSLFV